MENSCRHTPVMVSKRCESRHARQRSLFTCLVNKENYFESLEIGSLFNAQKNRRKIMRKEYIEEQIKRCMDLQGQCRLDDIDTFLRLSNRIEELSGLLEPDIKYKSGMDAVSRYTQEPDMM